MEEAARPDLGALWDFDRPAESGARFRALLQEALERDDATYRAELLTQIARAEGLQGRFEAADATLDAAASLFGDVRPRAKVRWLLERGRVRNSSGRLADAVRLFEEAWALAVEAGEDALAVDAAHMLGIAEAPGTPGTLWVMRQLGWHQRAISLAQRSADPKANAWLGSLLNDLGWTLHDAGRYDEALTAFERALAWREARGQVRETRIARWAFARCLRSLGRVTEALAIQERLRAEFDAAGEDDPYVDEELAECRLALGRLEEVQARFQSWG